MDIRSLLAARTYDAAKPATAATPQPAGPGQSFADLARDTVQTVQTGEDTARAAMLGKADSHALVQALAASELAVETAVTVRNRVVEAYQEILRMPV